MDDRFLASQLIQNSGFPTKTVEVYADMAGREDLAAGTGCVYPLHAIDGAEGPVVGDQVKFLELFVVVGELVHEGSRPAICHSGSSVHRVLFRRCLHDVVYFAAVITAFVSFVNQDLWHCLKKFNSLTKAEN